MKKQLLKSFFAFLIFNVAFLISAKAQIVYHDIIPDVTHTCIGGPLGSTCSQTYNLDLNNDGITDYVIESYHYTQYSPNYPPTKSFVRILPQGNNMFASTNLSTVKKLSQFDSIGTNLLSYQSTGQVFKHVLILMNIGEWNNEVNKYVGLKIIVGGQNYYGWARLNVNVVLGSATFTIKDYAYNSIPNQPILAGQTTTTGIIENNSSNHFSIYPNPATNSVTIKFPSDEAGEIQIINLFGCMVERQNYASLRDGTMQIDVSKFPAGMYVVRWSCGENYQTEKFSVMH